MYSYGSPHTAAQKQDDQHERTFSSYVRIQVVVLKTCLGRWTIGRSGEREGQGYPCCQHDMMMMMIEFIKNLFWAGRVDSDNPWVQRSILQKNLRIPVFPEIFFLYIPWEQLIRWIPLSIICPYSLIGLALDLFSVCGERHVSFLSKNGACIFLQFKFCLNFSTFAKTSWKYFGETTFNSILIFQLRP